MADQDAKEQAVWEYYNNLLGTAQERPEALNLHAFHQPSLDLADLDLPITETEVWDTIKLMPSDKASGPDGFTGRFYKACWPIIKHDVMAGSWG